MDRHTIIASALLLGALTGCNHTMPRTATAAAGDDATGFALPIVALAAAGRHVCAIGFADPVQCMYVDGAQTIVADVPGTEGAVDVAASDDGACALFGSGRVTCFGWSGTGTTGARLVAGMDDAFEIAVGGGLVCARSERGTVRCARDGDEAFDVTGITDAVEIAADAERACARSARGDVACWTGLDPEARMVAGIHDATTIAGGAGGLFAMTSHGQLHRIASWGRPEWVFSTAVASMPGATELVVAEGGVCGSTSRGETLCWDAASRTVRVPARLHGARDLAMGSRFACGLSGDGELRCASLGADSAHALPRARVTTARR